MSGQSCNVAGSKSAPFGHTSVPASSSSLTALNVLSSRSGPNNAPFRTGSKSMRCSVLSLNPTARVYGPTMLKRRHPMYWMAHGLPEWFDLDGRLAGLQEIPVVLQFRAVNFGPRLNEPELRLGKAAAQALDCVHCEYGRLILVVSVEVRSAMLPARFNEHSNNGSRRSARARARSNSSVVQILVVGLTCRFSRGGSGCHRPPSAASGC